MNRPILIPGLSRAWRGPRELQLGSDPTRAVSIELLDRSAAQVLDLLDGTRSERAALLRAAELGVPVEDARDLLETLQAAGLVLPAPDLLPSGLPHESRRRLIGEAAALALARKHPTEILRRRAASHVVLTGHGRLAAPIAVALAEAGVGSLQAEVAGTVGPGELAGGPLRGSDIGRLRRDAISDAISRAVPGLRPHPGRAATAPTSRSLPVRASTAPEARSAPVRASTAPETHSAPGHPTTTPEAHSRPGGPTAAPHPHSGPGGPTTTRRPHSRPGGAPTTTPHPHSGPGEPTTTRRSNSRPGGPTTTPYPRSRPEGTTTATLVVGLDHYEPPTAPHLAVTIRDGTPVIGPFVPPGGRPCLRCLDLHRRERDPSWPGPPRRPVSDLVEPCTVATLLAATAFATAEALAHLDGGRPQTLGAAIEITTPGRTRRRRWPPHPACACAVTQH